VVVAIFTGGIEALGLIGDKLSLQAGMSLAASTAA
jgi:high-affinity nickel permease